MRSKVIMTEALAAVNKSAPVPRVLKEWPYRCINGTLEFARQRVVMTDSGIIAQYDHLCSEDASVNPLWEPAWRGLAGAILMIYARETDDPNMLRVIVESIVDAHRTDPDSTATIAIHRAATIAIAEREAAERAVKESARREASDIAKQKAETDRHASGLSRNAKEQAALEVPSRTGGPTGCATLPFYPYGAVLTITSSLSSEVVRLEIDDRGLIVRYEGPKRI